MTTAAYSETTELRLRHAPLTVKEAEAFVREHHRHSPPRASGRFATQALLGDQLVGVGLAGRPNARLLDDKRTIEVLRVCTDGTDNACSFLYGVLHRIARVMGFTKAITYTLESESGASLRAAGYKPVARVKPDNGNRPSRPRTPKAAEWRIRWERGL